MNSQVFIQFLQLNSFPNFKFFSAYKRNSVKGINKNFIFKRILKEMIFNFVK